MKAFACDHCGHLVFFENDQCLKCGHALGFVTGALDLSALEPASDPPATWRALTPAAQGRLYRQCQNRNEHHVCNWLVPHDDASPLCFACRMNQTIPDLTVPGLAAQWHKMEMAKRRLIYTLLQLGLPIEGSADGRRPPLRFNFLAETVEQPVLTGHQRGVITVNIAEADDAEREKRRVRHNEPYRTLLGHFRHESAHYFWEQLIADTPRVARFRELFGDETQDYRAALQRHYAQGAPPDWPSRHVSAYASAHPWEDWAETWAHCLHIVDTLETAASFGMTLAPRHPAAPVMTTDPRRADAMRTNFDRLVKDWLPLTYALNSLNRGMGFPDLYPFVLPPVALDKMRFIHDTMQEVRRRFEA